MDLPNEKERRKILEIHLQKRGKQSSGIDLARIARDTEGFNGADLEGLIKDAVETAFIDNTVITTGTLIDTLHNAKSITDIQGDKIKKLRADLKAYSIKPASE